MLKCKFVGKQEQTGSLQKSFQHPAKLLWNSSAILPFKKRFNKKSARAQTSWHQGRLNATHHEFRDPTILIDQVTITSDSSQNRMDISKIFQSNLLNLPLKGSRTGSRSGSTTLSLNKSINIPDS